MANPPITIGPFNNVPAPGSAIQSAWAQQLTQAHVDYTTRPTEWKRTTIAQASQAFPTTGLVILNTPLVARNWPREITAELELFLVRTAGDNLCDVGVNVVGAVGATSGAHTVRTNFGNTVTLAVTALVTAGAVPTVQVSLAGVAAAVTVNTAGGQNFNSLTVVARPANAFAAIA